MDSSALLRAVLDNTGDPIFVKDLEGRCLLVNEACARDMGTTVDDLVGEFFDPYLPGDSAAKIRANDDAVISAGQPLLFEETIPFPDGPRHFHVIKAPVRDEDGNITGVVGIARSIDERKRAEAALQETVERLHLATEAAEIGIFEIDVGTGIARYSPELSAMLGVPDVAEAKVDAAFARVHRQDVERVKRLYHTAQDPSCNGRLRMEFRFVQPGGNIRWMTWNGKVEFRTHNGLRTPHRIRGACIDTTVAKSAELALKASEERSRLHLSELEAIYSTAHVGLCAFDRQLRFTRINERLAEMTGAASAHHIGKTPREIVPAIAEVLEGIAEQVLETGAGLTDVEIAAVTPAHPQGDRTWLQNWMPLCNADGEIIGLNVVVEDITARKRAEQEIRLLNREVSHRAKNLLSLVKAIARHTASSSPAEFLDKFNDRIGALSASQDLLIEGEWQSLELEMLVRSQLAHFSDLVGARIHISGPRLRITAAAAQSIGMAMYELATNAGKYGALSNEAGTIRINWQIDHAHNQPPQFVLEWTEEAGPAISPPERTGFGTTVVERMMKSALDADVALRFPPSGCTWRLACRAENVEAR